MGLEAQAGAGHQLMVAIVRLVQAYVAKVQAQVFAWRDLNPNGGGHSLIRALGACDVELRAVGKAGVKVRRLIAEILAIGQMTNQF